MSNTSGWIIVGTNEEFSKYDQAVEFIREGGADFYADPNGKVHLSNGVKTYSFRVMSRDRANERYHGYGR